MPAENSAVESENLESCSTKEQTGSWHRLDGIDILRGISILLVVIHHINIRIRIEETSFGQHLPRFLAMSLGWNGQSGVTIFFAISGFLITTMTLRRWKTLAQVNLREFYTLRFARIAPLLFLLLTVLSVLHLCHVRFFTIKPEQGTLVRALFAALTFHLNWLEGQRGYLPGGWDVQWSLSIEEMFYLFFPLLCRWLKNGRWLVTVLLAFVAVGPFARTVFTQNPIWRDKSYLGSMDAIALGCLAAMLLPHLRCRRRQLLALKLVGMAMILLILGYFPAVKYLGLYRTGLDVTVLAVGTCLVMLEVGQTYRQGRWFSQPLLWFGRHSYEIYLTHVFVVLWVVQAFRAYGSPMGAALYWYLAMILLSAALGAVTARGYSEPMNRWIRRKCGWARPAEGKL